MSVTVNSDEMTYAVVEYLKCSHHIYDPVDGKPEKDGQDRLVCLTVYSKDAWKMAHLSRALNNDPYWYSMCVAEPEITCRHDQTDCEECGTGTYHEKGLRQGLHR